MVNADREPDEGEDERCPATNKASKASEERRHALAAAETAARPAQQVADEGARTPPPSAGPGPTLRPRCRVRRRALEQIEREGRRREPLAAGAQHVGRADVARADRAQITRPAEPRQDQAERNRA